jgi:beta-aspartyl-dipeptidase (metallo-type)
LSDSAICLRGADFAERKGAAAVYAPAVLVVLRDGDVFAPEPLGRQDILVAGGRIAAMAPRLPPLPASLATERDLGGRAVIPGLIDAHVHVTGGGGESGPASRIAPLTRAMIAASGVTTCVGLLGTDGTTRTVASLVARTLGLRQEGLSAYCYTGSYELPLQTLTGSVRRDIVFVDPIVGVGELAISDHRSSQPTLDELLRVASDAHVAGMMSGKAGLLHLHLGDGERGLDLVRRALDGSELPARVFHPTHVNRQRRLFEEAVALTGRGVTIDVTAFPPGPLDDPGLSAASALAAYFGSGGPSDRVTCSSDGGGCLPVFDANGSLVSMDVGRPTTLLDTVRELVGLGVGLDVALRPFTSNVASLFRFGAKGTIAPGRDADLVVLGRDLKVETVMARGAWIT